MIQSPTQTRRPPATFSLFARVLHWSMAAGILAMLFIGVGMVASVSERHQWLVQIHKPLGLALLALVCIRLGRRVFKGAPALPADLPALQRHAALASHVLLYALMFAMPLIGWDAVGGWLSGRGGRLAVAADCACGCSLIQLATGGASLSGLSAVRPQPLSRK